jgi:ribosomal protein L7Ae-like RNA K-turn-binding protein
VCSSDLTAAGVVSWKSIGKALRTVKPAHTEQLQKYSAGYYMRTSQKLTDMEANVNRTSPLAKGTNKMMNTIQAADLWTTRKMLWAAEYEIQDTTNLKEGTEEYWKAVAKKYEDILEISQPTSGVMQKDAISRSTSEGVRMMTMFRTQISKNLNAIVNTVTG